MNGLAIEDGACRQVQCSNMSKSHSLTWMVSFETSLCRNRHELQMLPSASVMVHCLTEQNAVRDKTCRLRKGNYNRKHRAAPKTEGPKQQLSNSCNSITTDFFFFRWLSAGFPSRQSYKLWSLEDDKCLPPMFVLALPAHHINQMVWKQKGQRHDDDIWLSKWKRII